MMPIHHPFTREKRLCAKPVVAKEPRYDVRVRNGQVEVKRIGDH